MKALVDEPADDGYAPYALSSPGGLEAHARAPPACAWSTQARSRSPGPTRTRKRPCVRCSRPPAAPGASRVAGERRVREALVDAIEPFQDGSRSGLDPERVPLRGRRQALSARAVAARCAYGSRPSIARAIAQLWFQRNIGRSTGVSTRSSLRSACTCQSKRTWVPSSPSASASTSRDPGDHRRRPRSPGAAGRARRSPTACGGGTGAAP